MVSADKPTEVDKLGFKPYVKGIARLIQDITVDNLPRTVGIYGSWGSGKTSFMMQLKKLLGEISLPTVWFEAWKYESMHDLRSALLNKVLDTIEENVSDGKRQEIEDIAQTIGKTLVEMFMHSRLSFGIPGFNISMPSVAEAQEKAVQEFADNRRRLQTDVDKLSDEFNEAVELSLVDGNEFPNKKLVVFIDDLDRCLPQNVITVLEALKLFLDKSHCIFVIVIDRTVAERAVREHYGADPVEYGRVYLDKIIQHPFSIPPASPEKLNECFKHLVGSISLDDKSEYVFKQAADGNPRTYLRLVSAWNLITALASEVNNKLIEDGNIKTLALAIALHTRFPQFYEVCRNNHEKLPFFMDFCKNPQVPRDITMPKYFQSNIASEFVIFYEDASLRRFLSSLICDLTGTRAERVVGDRNILKQALDLTERAE